MLIDAMKEEMRKGNFADNGFKTQGCEAITKYMHQNGCHPRTDQIQCKYKHWKILNELKNLSGWGWDSTNKCVAQERKSPQFGIYFC